MLDFGLAKPLEPVVATSPVDTRSPTITAAAVTRIGPILGTAGYMSPEQVKEKAVDERADIWAFGCVCYEMLAGHTAFAAETVAETFVAILEHEPDWTRLPTGLPSRVSDLLRRCLQKDPRARVQNFSIVSETICKAVDASTSGVRVRRLAAAGAIAAVTVGIGGTWMLKREVGLRRVEQAIVEASQLADKDEYTAALARIAEVGRIAPHEPRLGSLADRVSVVRSILTAIPLARRCSSYSWAM